MGVAPPWRTRARARRRQCAAHTRLLGKLSRSLCQKAPSYFGCALERTRCVCAQRARSTRRNCPPPASTCVVTVSPGANRDSRSNSHAEAFSASARVRQRATTSRPPLRVNRSTVATIGAGSTTNSSGDQATMGLTAPLRVLQARWARRSAPAAAFLPFGETPLSTLGPRSALTEASGSTGSSHSQQRQESRSPTSLRVLMARGYGFTATDPTDFCIKAMTVSYTHL